jgi:hypothetical protein
VFVDRVTYRAGRGVVDQVVRRDRLLGDENLLIPDQPPQTPEGWEWWFLWVTKKAIKTDHLVHHTTPNTPRDDQTHLVHATCSRAGKHARTAAGNTVLQPTT